VHHSTRLRLLRFLRLFRIAQDLVEQRVGQ
jgi:hypothetical protein